MATMVDVVLGALHTFQEFIQAQSQQRTPSGSAPSYPTSTMRPSSPVQRNTTEAGGTEQRKRLQEDRSDMKAFQEMRPPVFQGEIDFKVADKWVARMEKIFKYLQCTDEQRIRYATFMLEGEAEAWWETEQRTLSAESQLSWAEFLERFYRHYVPESERSRRAAEFMLLIQGRQSVAEYNAQFLSLKRFAPWTSVDPRAAARKFQEGLRPSIRRSVALFGLTEYNDILDKALMAEREEEECGKIREKRKSEKWNSQDRRSKPKTGPAGTPQGTIICLQCGQPGHRKAECPQLAGRPQYQGQGQQYPAQGQQNPTQGQQVRPMQGQGQKQKRHVFIVGSQDTGDGSVHSCRGQ